MVRPRQLALCAWFASLAACQGSAAHAQPGFDLARPTDVEPARGWESLLDGWTDFANGWLVLDMVIVLVIALLLGAVIGYHPATRRRMSSLEHFEQPKTVLMYSMVAAVVALIVKVQPAMAFVIFGIGGLLRFRTLVGEAKDTGRVILVTVVGLCCGLKIFIVAVPATAIGWLVVYFLEQQPAGIIRVSGVAEDKMHASNKAHRALIEASGFTVIGEQTKFIKREFAFVVKAPPTIDRERLDADFDALPDELRGVIDWEQL